MDNIKCARCDKIIPKARLKALPNTEYCVDCSKEISAHKKVKNKHWYPEEPYVYPYKQFKG